ncbi:Pimeloyl-ACP methyl ester carboxylesterase [Bosea sp. 62]|uniref:alpha/beta fold hydrolase n=1 Tax=unclassified Bosea (in: a-proteobacteria) TaxID=2653178 RepID=UPI00125423C8|nr:MULTISPECIES: alpha/beta hydrolase [unclassified Bosea (in: a-proteobacteria)]CAD5256730.1 Pimeloyl-ACP methyl ester carboxylesterase [Bosea sp. 46]CAD5261098.1 Pimeloyl-ACP methyl ester carboxylesterase [Bosea sp. 21B]CAD5279531.1 Pimeloyl-ACP methyl ester carboxylesterase [Bosea sp. 7B]VVT58397.1 Pimeloyl-ACP methyl ester carboxylesterase [Bosea sp. EC-HK365B]VXB52782.1 Pimeloyl-ACP methyl ester carboxylesterase [Bosea sp. 29B]
MPKTDPIIERNFIGVEHGRMHAATCGTGFPVLLLHQTPRSWDEYRDVLPLIGGHRRAIAIDTPGFGDSEPLPGMPTIEDWAAAALELLSALAVERFAVVGHHTGAAIAVEIAARAPDRVAAAVLSACPFVDAARRERHANQRVIDDVTERADGSHLAELWNRRRPFYPENDTELLGRFMADALRSGPMAVEGHRVVNRYRMEDRLGLIACPTLVLVPENDPNARSGNAVAAAICGSVMRSIPGAQVPFPDQMPAIFAEQVDGFLRDHGC